jgi:glutamate carboxypeptidase
MNGSSDPVEAKEQPAAAGTAAAVRAFLSEQKEEMVAFLSDLVRAESPSDSPEAQAVPLAMLWEALNDMDFDVRLVSGQASGGYLLAEYDIAQGGAVAERQLLLGHTDTVWPQGTLHDMPLVVEDVIVRGPGVYDMKGGLTQMIFALRAVRGLNLPLSLAPAVLVNSDEEIGSMESLPAIRREAQRARRAFVLEPSLGQEGKLKTARKGVGNFEIVAHGRAAHAGLDPEKGKSAVLALAYLIPELHALNDRQRGVTVNVGIIEGGLSANVVPPRCRAVIDVRAPSQQDAEQVARTIHNLRAADPAIHLEISGGFGRPPLERTEANQALWRQAQLLGGELGLALGQGMAGGGSDGNYASQYTATLDGLGAVGDGAHATHEYIYIDKMVERAALLALLLIAP